MDKKQTKIGCNVFVLNSAGELLLGLRKNQKGFDSWGLPGGHLKYKERTKDGALRELYEETGMQVNPSEVELLLIDNDVNDKGVHYIDFDYILFNCNKEVELREPDKTLEWKYFQLNRLPKPLFAGHINGILKFKEKLQEKRLELEFIE